MDNAPPISRPYRVAFVLVDGFALMSYSAAMEPLRAANLLAGEELYAIDHVAVSGDKAVSSAGTEIPATAHAGDVLDIDLLLVVAGGDPARFDKPRVFQWLRQMARRDVLIGGVSGGPVVLARAGLMEGRRMTVHWEHAPALAEISPSLMVERSLYVIDRDRVTCAGGIAPLDLMHALIAMHHGHDFARKVSDWFLHTEVRPSGGPQRASLVERYGTTSPMVIRAIETMENHIAEPLGLDALAQRTGCGPRQLNRLFGDKLGTTTMAFYRELRLQKARNLLAQTTLSITEIALATGFSNSAHFSDAFRRKYAAAPSAMRR